MNKGAQLGNKNAIGNSGRAPNWLREACREASARIDTVGILERAAAEESGKDRIKAIEMLWDRGWGKAEQISSVTNYDGNRPTADTLIQTITVLRAELDSLRAGTGSKKGK